MFWGIFKVNLYTQVATKTLYIEGIVISRNQRPPVLWLISEKSSCLWETQIARDSRPGREWMLAWLKMIVRWIPGSCFSTESGKARWMGGRGTVGLGQASAPKVEHDLISLEKTGSWWHLCQGSFQQLRLKLPGQAGLPGRLEWSLCTQQRQHTYMTFTPAYMHIYRLRGGKNTNFHNFWYSHQWRSG